MEIPDIIKRLLEEAHVIEVHGPDCDHRENEDHSDWIQVGQVSGDDILRKKKYIADVLKAKRDIDLYEAKSKAAFAAAVAHRAEWWNYIREKFSINGSGDLHLTDDGRILMKPEKKEKGNGQPDKN